MRLRSVLAWVPVAMVFVACGSDDSDGDATGGKTTCAAGATQACTCNGSDTGVQVCAGDGKSWGACSCGASGGTGGTGGDAATGGGSGGAGGSSATGGATGGTAGAGGDGGIDGGPESDPCPTEPLDRNCSNDCGGPDPYCSVNGCVGLFDNGNWVPETSKSKYVCRTASAPQVEKLQCCDCCPTHYGEYVVHIPSSAGIFKIAVGKPWLVGFLEANGSVLACSDAGTAAFQKGCVVSSGHAGSFRITTGDPNAGARNIVFEKVPANVTCAASDYWQ